MLVLRCTQKLLTELKLPKDELGDPADGFLGSWFAHLFRLERRKCVLFTNSQTLYCVLLFGLLKYDFERLPLRFVDALTANLEQEGIPAEAVARLRWACHPVTWGPTNNRSVLGSANEYIQLLKHRSQFAPLESPQNAAELSARLNRTPMSALPDVFPIDAISAALHA
ncbi:hypothetical protein FJ251_00380 [bacterium]|nr:hypothetical protein [bacterium]